MEGMKSLFCKENLVHVWAIILFLVLSVAYFAPVVFQGKTMGQGDVHSWRGTQQENQDCYEKTGEYSHWSNMLFGGTPNVGSDGYNVYNKFFPRIATGGLPILSAGILFFYMLGVYILLCVMGCTSWLSVLGAIAYAFATYNIVIIDAGHANKAWAMACMAPTIAGVMLCFRGKYLWGGLVTLIFTGMHIMYSHQQITYYLLIMLLAMAIAYGIQAFRNKAMKDFLKGGFVALGFAIVSLLPTLGGWLVTYDYSKDTMRGGPVLKQNPQGEVESTGLELDYAFQWSQGKMETLTLLIPQLYGGSSHYGLSESSQTYKLLQPSGQTAFAENAPMYWGDQPFTSGPVYVGAIICMLFVLGLFIVKGPDKWWLLVVTVISVILSCGRSMPGINNFLFEHLPLYDRFRTPSMALVIAELSMVMLACLALKTIIEDKDRSRYWKQLLYAVGITGGICLVFALFGKSFFSFDSTGDARYPDMLQEAFRADRASLLVKSAWTSLLFILLAFVSLWAYMRKSFKTDLFLGSMILWVLVDLWGTDRKYVGEKNFYPARAVKAVIPTDADNAILADRDPNYRVFNVTVNTFNDASTSNFHKSIGGYSPMKLRRYQDIIDYHFSNGVNMKVLNMLNTKYFIVPGRDGKPVAQYNPGALGHAWFVDSIRWVNSPDEEIMALYDFEPARTALVDVEWRDKAGLSQVEYPDPDFTCKIDLVDYLPNKLTYRYTADMSRPVVFADVYYKTWKAYVDGQEIPLYRVNYILRGATLPQGEHTVVLECINPIRKASGWMTNLGSAVNILLILGLIAGLVYKGVYKEKKLEKVGKDGICQK